MSKVANVHLAAAGASILGTDHGMGRETGEEAERVFAATVAGGKVEMPLAEPPWSKRFAMSTDRYGMPWMVNCMKQPI